MTNSTLRRQRGYDRQKPQRLPRSSETKRRENDRMKTAPQQRFKIKSIRPRRKKKKPKLKKRAGRRQKGFARSKSKSRRNRSWRIERPPPRVDEALIVDCSLDCPGYHHACQQTMSGLGSADASKFRVDICALAACGGRHTEGTLNLLSSGRIAPSPLTSTLV